LKKREAKDLSVVKEATDFFRGHIIKALANQKISIDQNTEFYLVDLLTRFMFSENLYPSDQKGARREEILALLLADAMSAANAGSKHRSLRRLGDVSLYTAGFFADRLSRKIVDVDYYIGMGSSAYRSLAASGFDDFFRRVFLELSSQFHKFVDVLGEVSDATGRHDAKSILRLYELWLKTKSERAERGLKEAGIIPNGRLKPDWQ
jgi:hypothetical protein